VIPSGPANEKIYVASIIGSIVRNPIVQDAAREAFKVALRAIMKKLG